LYFLMARALFFLRLNFNPRLFMRERGPGLGSVDVSFEQLSSVQN